ncbi:hypothetical protein NBH00_10545 [Paraconexibacter antarcticus]|uniref:Uncharacterized protein n=1 Tax=Paraconexibacter antarcticus TaxID=2949664 RepID=A0ABY5E0A5_9ACTN|nr:hypothetical protein [Paraconexibacter antarcticus]UTI66629.1 hypothetical protein NBH00_10545 [Paraconexibacter antarcticus]
MPGRHRLAVVLVAGAVLLAGAARASALSLGVGTGATLSPFRPGQTATGSGSLTIVSLGAWTLTAEDDGPGAGHMVKGAAGCTGSSAQTTNQLTVAVTALGVTSAGAKAIGATPVQVASGGLTAGLLMTTAYSLVIPSAQTLLTGCAYSETVTYTAQ